MIGVAFEVHDASHMKKRDGESDEEWRLKQAFQMQPGVLDMIHYSCCYIGLFTGRYIAWSPGHDTLFMLLHRALHR